MATPPEAVLEALNSAAGSGGLPPGESILLAVSGGADSLALLHGAAELGPDRGWRLSVAHVHHGWRGRDADRDLSFVRDRAKRLGLPFLSRSGDARAIARDQGLSPEAGARRLRYTALAGMAWEARAVRTATAHQRDDRLESYLLARERRGGVAGLGGPRERREDGVVRPLLAVSRREIVEFLRTRGLSWRRDATNGDLSLARNRVRREIAAALPADRRRWEAEVDACARERDALDLEFSRLVAPAIRRGPGSVILPAAALADWPPDLVRLAIEAAARPFARPGRAPMTGREREQVLGRIESGGVFRIEAGRRIEIERRGAVLAFRMRTERPRRVYDSEPKPAGDS